MARKTSGVNEQTRPRKKMEIFLGQKFACHNEFFWFGFWQLAFWHVRQKLLRRWLRLLMHVLEFFWRVMPLIKGKNRNRFLELSEKLIKNTYSRLKIVDVGCQNHRRHRTNPKTVFLWNLMWGSEMELGKRAFSTEHQADAKFKIVFTILRTIIDWKKGAIKTGQKWFKVGSPTEKKPDDFNQIISQFSAIKIKMPKHKLGIFCLVWTRFKKNVTGKPNKPEKKTYLSGNKLIHSNQKLSV